MNNPNAAYNPNPNTTTIGMDGNLAALLSYIIGIVGIIVLITEKENKFVKFHALQALLFHVLFAVIFIGAFVLLFIIGIFATFIGAALGNAGAVIGIILYVVIMVLWFALIIVGPLTAIGGNIYSGIQAYNGKWFRLPIVGNLSAKILGITF